jgi:hypothetical protein
VEKLGAIIGLAAATLSLLTFFFRAWGNLRRGRRIQKYRRRKEIEPKR